LVRPAEADATEARLVADDDAAHAERLAGAERAALDDVLDAHRHAVAGRDDDLADLADAAVLLGAQPGGDPRLAAARLHAVAGRDDDLADLADAAVLLGAQPGGGQARVAQGQHLLDRVLAAADQ